MKIIITSQEELSFLIQANIREALQVNFPVSNYISIKEASAYLNLSVQTIYRLTSKGRIPFIKKGKKLLFQTKELDIWLNSNSNH